MSSLADAPDDEPARVTATAAGPAARIAGVTGGGRAWIARRQDPITTVLLAAIVVAASFLAGGGGSLQHTTWVAIGLTLLGGAAVAVAIVLSPPQRRLWGGVTLLLLGVLTAYTAYSIRWSFAPADTWNVANLTVGYLATFAGAVALVRVAPRRWTSLLYAVVLSAVVLSAWALIVKVFPSIEPYATYARLRAPFDYWNAVGLIAAMGIPACLWLGARRDGHAAPRALSVPALWLMLVALLLCVGRGSMIAALAALVLWFAVVPLRLRGAALLLVAGAGAAVVAMWAFGNDALTTDGMPLDVRSDAGTDLGILLVTMLVVLLLAGLWLSFALSRATFTREQRLAVGGVLLVLVALAPIALVGRLAISDRGLTGSISDGWRRLTDPNAQQPGNDPSRLGSVGSVRARYWDDALTIWKLEPPRTRWLGVGAEGYGTARRPLQRDRLRVSHAHGYVAQTLADLGLVGIGVNALLLVAWIVAAIRTTALTPRRRYGSWLVAVARRRDPHQPVPRRAPVPWTAERIGLVTLTTMVVAFGVHSTIDWTWFVPGTAVVALLCAGWVAGRGPVTEPAGGAVAPSGATALGGVSFARLGLAATVVLAALAATWVIWQPQRAVSLEESALEAQANGRLTRARADAQQAADVNPLSTAPLIALGGIEAEAQEPERALRTLTEAVELQPASSEPWLALGELQLQQGNVADALASLMAAAYLNPWSPLTQDALARAQAAANPAAAGTEPPTTPAP